MRIDHDGPFVTGERFLGPSLHQQRLRQEILRVRISRITVGGASQERLGVRGCLAMQGDEAKRVEHVRIAWPLACKLAQGIACAALVALLLSVQRRDGKIEARFEPVRMACGERSEYVACRGEIEFSHQSHAVIELG